jgi:hypothetical protein
MTPQDKPMSVLDALIEPYTEPAREVLERLSFWSDPRSPRHAEMRLLIIASALYCTAARAEGEALDRASDDAVQIIRSVLGS